MSVVKFKFLPQFEEVRKTTMSSSKKLPVEEDDSHRSLSNVGRSASADLIGLLVTDNHLP